MKNKDTQTRALSHSHRYGHADTLTLNTLLCHPNTSRDAHTDANTDTRSCTLTRHNEKQVHTRARCLQAGNDKLTLTSKETLRQAHTPASRGSLILPGARAHTQARARTHTPPQPPPPAPQSGPAPPCGGEGPGEARGQGRGPGPGAGRTWAPPRGGADAASRARAAAPGSPAAAAVTVVVTAGPARVLARRSPAQLSRSERRAGARSPGAAMVEAAPPGPGPLRRTFLVPEIKSLDQYDFSRAKAAASLAWVLRAAFGGAGTRPGERGRQVRGAGRRAGEAGAVGTIAPVAGGPRARAPARRASGLPARPRRWTLPGRLRERGGGGAGGPAPRRDPGVPAPR